MNAAAPMPALLLPYQQRIMADQSKIRVIEKSRRVGGSYGLAAEAALEAAAQEGQDTWYTGYNKDMAKEYILDVAEWAKLFHLVASEIFEEDVLDENDKKIPTFYIKFASGWRVTALSSAASNIRGKQGHVIIDEAAFHPDLRGMVKAGVAMLMWGGRLTIISTHFGVDNHFNDLVQDARSGAWKGAGLHTITLRDALAEGLYRRICLVKKRQWSQAAEDEWAEELFDFYRDNADEELMCIPSQGEGRFFSRAMVEACMRADFPVLRLAKKAGFVQLPDAEREKQIDNWLKEQVEPLLKGLNPNEQHFMGEDFGRSGDLTVMMPCALAANLQRRVPFALELRNVPFRQQEQIAFFILDRLPRFTAAAFDARGNGQFLAEVAAQRYGALRVHQITASEGWYIANAPRYKAALEDGDMLLPKDADLLADHGLVQLIKGVPKLAEKAHTKGTDGHQRHGDAYMAALMAHFASCIEVAMPEHHSRGVKRASYAGGQDYLGGLG